MFGGRLSKKLGFAPDAPPAPAVCPAEEAAPAPAEIPAPATAPPAPAAPPAPTPPTPEIPMTDSRLNCCDLRRLGTRVRPARAVRLRNRRAGFRRSVR
ncbi:hypothetical protein GC176_27465 [bacterium]|nr:hypothetical protein [bacterium]